MGSNNKKIIHDGIVFIGEKFNKLTILKLVPSKSGNLARYLCRCDCGNEKEINFSELKHGGTKSCGCLKRESQLKSAKKYRIDWDAPERICCKCKTLKNVEEFSKGMGGRMCKECDRKNAQSYRNSGRQRQKEIPRKYGISFEQFLQLVEEQQNKCKICSKELETGVNGLVVDHCHEVNKVRGILCRDCNLGLGFFKDDVIRLLKAIDYLKNNYSNKY
jgi:hypothetical protein